MRVNLIFSFLVVASSTAYAGGAGAGMSIVYDPTNHIETALTSAQSVYAETQRATQIYNQVLQYKQALLQNKNLDPNMAASLLAKTQNDMTDLKTYIGGMNQLITDNGQLQNVLQNRQIDYNNSGLNSADYIQREQQRIKDGDQQRAQIAQHEAAILRNINNDAKFIEEAQAKIPGASQAQSAELMNMQLNKLLAQNSTLIQLQAENSLAAKAKEKQLEERSGVDNANALKMAETMKRNTQSLINNIGSGSQGAKNNTSVPPSKSGGAANLSPAAKAALGL